MNRLLLALLLIVGCGYPTAKHEATFATTAGWGVARARAIDSLTRRGYRINDGPVDVVQTDWRFIRIYPDEYRETWFNLRIRVTVTDTGKIVGECMQKRYGTVKARAGKREPLWFPCTDPNLLAMINNAVDDIARDLNW